MTNHLVLVVSAVFLTSVAFAENFHQSSNNAITCDPQSDDDCQSESLETIAAKVAGQRQTDVQIDITIPQLYLNAPVKFADLKSLVIKGNSTTITCIANSTAGIQLSHIADRVTLSNLIINSCGTEIQRHKTYISALIILNCSNVELTEIVIEKSNGIGLMILNHTGGRVSITSALFAENTLSQKYGNSTKERLYGGGGVYMKFSGGPIYPTTILFDDCSFENNTSNNTHYKLSYTDVGDTQENDGNGGGVYMNFGGGSVNVHVSFTGCTFIGNQAFIGGGLSAQIHRKNYVNINNITFGIIDSLFKENGCMKSKYTVFGGAMYLRLESVDGTGITNSHFIVRNVTFFENCADLGGSVYYYSHHDRLHSDDSNNSMQFDTSMFIRNKAHAGSALVMIPDIFLKRYRGYTIVPVFQNCQFLNNSVFVGQSRTQWTQRIPGVGTVYVSLSDINFQGYNVFKNNWGTALYAINGVMDFQNSSVSFINNSGLQGGAVALIGLAKITVGSNNNYEFINNSATFLGGAIYVSLTDITDFIVSKSCFIQYADNDSANISIMWDANITFIGNRAKDSSSGHAIYATSLFPCQAIRCGTRNQVNYQVINVSAIFTTRGIIFDNDTKLQPQLATDGATLSFNKTTPLMIIPGEYYEHNIMTTNDLGQRTNSSFRVAIVSKESDNFIQLDSAFSNFIGDELQLTGKPGENATLYFEILSPRQSYVKLSVTLLKCPPGFKSNNDSRCVCNAHNHMGLLRCNEDEFYSYLLPGYWTGFIGSKLVTSVCRFCLTTSRSEITLPRNSTELNGILCGETRTGIACGKCTDNYTVHFHSPDFLCRPAEPVGCKLGWLFYILSELIPITVMFIIVLGFNISFTSGVVNGFILYSQLLDSVDIYASGIIAVSDTRIENVALVLYGFFNLDLFGSGLFSFCLWKGASALDMIAIKYFTIIYAILLIMAVAWTMNRCGGRYLGKYCRITTVKASVIHGISSFLMISYAQCIKVSLSLLLRLYIHPEHDSGFKVHPRVWYNGEIVHFSREHLPYALPALFCLFTVGALPPVLLLTYPLLNKLLDYFGLEDKKYVKLICAILPIASLKPLLDSFQGCFKDKFRFFAGLYFLYRWSFLLVHFNAEFSIYYTSVSGVLVFILTLHTICQPYIKRAHNIIDTLLFSNLILINCLLFFNYHNSHNQKPQYTAVSSAAVVQLVLICLPMMVMYVYLLVILCNQIFKHICGRKSQAIFTSRTRKLVQVVSARDERSDLNMEDFTHDRLVDEDAEYRSTYNCFEEEETLPYLYTY